MICKKKYTYECLTILKMGKGAEQKKVPKALQKLSFQSSEEGPME